MTALKSSHPLGVQVKGMSPTTSNMSNGPKRRLTARDLKLTNSILSQVLDLCVQLRKFKSLHLSLGEIILKEMSEGSWD